LEELKMIIKTPMEIKNELDKTVIGQDHAKKVIATEVYKHYMRIHNEDWLRDNNRKLSKSNILLTGLSGTGKTFLAEQVAKILEVPFSISDCTTLTEAGYVGEDVENVLRRLIESADYDIEDAEKGIIVLDEIDKIGRKGENASITRDVSGEGVQQAILKIIEGTISEVPEKGGRKNPYGECMNINTKNILFIGAGSFEGIENIVSKRLKKGFEGNRIGFNVANDIIKNEYSQKELRQLISRNDLHKFGMLPELLGRFPNISNLLPLDKNDLVNILSLNDGILSDYKTLFELQKKELIIKDEVFETIAEIALSENVGARGLKSIIENSLSELMFNAPSEKKKKYTIDRQFIENNYKKDSENVA
jgi:ATP-dependent Clp protease ATP-binding subunit ClpX